MRTSAKRLVKVRNALVLLIQIADNDEQPAEYNELPPEDQKEATLLAKGLIELVDGLFMPYKRKKDD